jgi:hypothetical protein
LKARNNPASGGIRIPAIVNRHSAIDNFLIRVLCQPINLCILLSLKEGGVFNASVDEDTGQSHKQFLEN